MTHNAWNVTPSEYKRAYDLSGDANIPEPLAELYWQLVRYYRGQIFCRDDAANALRLIRAVQS